MVNILQKILDPDPEVDDVENLINSSLSTATSVLKFLWRCVQYFLRKVANIQADRQTNKRRALHNLLGGDNYSNLRYAEYD